MAKHNRRREQARRQRSAHATASSSAPAPRGTIYDVLKRDHARVTQLLDALARTSDDAVRTREEAFARLRDELDAHSRAEEMVLYARLHRAPATRERILASIEQHHVVTVLLGELDAMPKDHERWKAKLGVLGEALRRHIDDEEQRLFPAAAAILDPETEREMATEMTRQKDAWLELERRSPTAGAMVRGLTQVAERMPFGGGVIASTVQSNPRRLMRMATVARWVFPGPIPRFMFRTLTRPIGAPLALVMPR